MKLEEYIDGARRTESSKQPLHADTTALGLTNRMLHGIVGISTEMGEIVEAYQRTNIDLVNVAEEIGDAYWYTAVLMDELGIVRVDTPAGLGAISACSLPKQLVVQSAEMLDKCKKTMFYGKEYDVEALKEQVSRFYVTLGLFVDGLAEEIDVTKEKIWTINLNKLKIRYPEKFNLTDAEVRDLQAERIVLETVN